MIYEKMFNVVWPYYLKRQLSLNDMTLEYEKVVKEIKSINSDFGSKKKIQCENNISLVLYNSGRDVKKNKMKKAIRNYEKIKGYSSSDTIFLNVFRKKNFFSISDVHFLIFKIFLFNLFFVTKSFINNYNFYLLVFSCVREWIKNKKIGRLYLFSSNNRLTEIIRLAALAEGVKHVEFLHGICTDEFSDYYKILDAYTEHSCSKTDYINMLPGLPQPPCIVKNILVFNDREVFFRNERLWEPAKESFFDVVIIGGDCMEATYIGTSYFKSELEAAIELSNAGLKVVYCPHPNRLLETPPLMPDGVFISNASGVINSSKLIVGNFSTMLFSAHLLGFNTLIFQEAWELIPNNIKALYSNVNANTYSYPKASDVILNYSNEKYKLSDNNNSLDILDL